MQEDYLLEDLRKIEELQFGRIYHMNYIDDKNIYFVHEGKFGELIIEDIILPNENMGTIKELEIYTSICYLESISKSLNTTYVEVNQNGLAVFRKFDENYKLVTLFDVRNNNPHIVEDNIDEQYKLMFKEKTMKK